MGDLTDIAMKLRDEFDSRAAALDLDAGIPSENYEQMREAGYLSGTVPTELGGLGAGPIEFAHAQRALSWGCASTALMVNMHLFQVGAAAEGWHTSGANEPALRRVAEEGIILASTAAEAVVAGAWDTPTTATPDGDGGYVINGRKYFCSQADLMDLVRVNARDVETGEIVVFAVPARTPGVSVERTWDTTGMRGTCSNDLILDNVSVPAGAVGVRLPAESPAWHPAFASVIRWFLSGVSGVYLGIADRARDEALAAVNQAGNGAHRATALTDAMVGRLEAAHFTASSVLEVGLQRVVAEKDPLDGFLAAVLMKQQATTLAAEVVEHAVDVAGGRSFFRRSPLERLARDVRAAQFHPPSAPVSYQIVGSALTGRAPLSR